MLRSFQIAMTAFALLLPSLSAQASDNRRSHAAGFICGAGPGFTNNRIVDGDYRAAFNVMNINRRSQEVSFTLSLTFPADSDAGPGAPFTPGRVIELQSVDLHPGQAVMIDCQELADAAGLPLGGRPPYFSGVLEAAARRSLDVTLLQTSGPIEGDVSSHSVTKIEAQSIRR